MRIGVVPEWRLHSDVVQTALRFIKWCVLPPFVLLCAMFGSNEGPEGGLRPLFLSR